MDRNKIFCERQFHSDNISVHWMQGTSVAKEVIFEAAIEGQYTNPFMYLPTLVAQNLMDELWQCGLRPSEGSGSAGSLRATEKHLEDMRRLAFHKIIPSK